MGAFSGDCTTLPPWVQRSVPTQLWVAQGRRKGGRFPVLMSRRGLGWERVIGKSQSFNCCLYAFIIIAFLWKVSFKEVNQIQCFTGEANFEFRVLLPYPVVWMWLSIFSAFPSVARHWADALMVLSESILEFSGNHIEPVQNLFDFSWFAPPWK